MREDAYEYKHSKVCVVLKQNSKLFPFKFCLLMKFLRSKKITPSLGKNISQFYVHKSALLFVGRNGVSIKNGFN